MKPILYSFSIILFGILAFTGCSEDEVSVFGSISGTIRDANTGNPIYNAEIMLSPGNKTTVSGSDGNFEFNNLESKQYTLNVTATGYQYNTRSVNVIPGEDSKCDMRLVPEVTSSAVKLSTNNLNFDSSYTELTFDILNIGTSGDIVWRITDITADWITVSPMTGTTAMGKSSSIKVMVDRSSITEDSSTIFNVEAAGGSYSVMVNVKANVNEPDNGDEPSNEDKPGNGDGPGNEDNNGNEDKPGNGEEPGNEDNNGDVGSVNPDYSSAEITSCDQRVLVKLIDCERLGSSVVMHYTLTNDGLGTCNDFRIMATSQTPSGAITYAYDDNGNSFLDNITVTMGNSSANWNMVSGSLPPKAPVICSIVLQNVPTDTKIMNYVIGCYAYPNSLYNLTRQNIEILNVPIY